MLQIKKLEIAPATKWWACALLCKVCKGFEACLFKALFVLHNCNDMFSAHSFSCSSYGFISATRFFLKTVIKLQAGGIRALFST